MLKLLKTLSSTFLLKTLFSVFSAQEHRFLGHFSQIPGEMSDSGKVPGKVPDSGEMSDSGVRFLRHFSQRLTRDGGQGSLFPQILARALFSATSVCTYPGVPLHVHPVYTRPGCPWPVLPVLTCVRCYFRSSSGRIRWFPIPLFRAPPDARHLSVRRST